MPEPTINVVQDVTTVLNQDETAIAAQQTTIQSQIDALNAQIAALQAQVAVLEAQKADNAEGLDIIGRFREVVAQFTAHAGFGFVLVPAGPTQDPASATPLTPGITS